MVRNKRSSHQRWRNVKNHWFSKENNFYCALLHSLNSLSRKKMCSSHLMRHFKLMSLDHWKSSWLQTVGIMIWNKQGESIFSKINSWAHYISIIYHNLNHFIESLRRLGWMPPRNSHSPRACDHSRRSFLATRRLAPTHPKLRLRKRKNTKQNNTKHW